MISRYGPARPEHVLVANDVLDRLGPQRAHVERIWVDGVAIDEPQHGAASLKSTYAKTQLPVAVTKSLSVTARFIKKGQGALAWLCRKLGLTAAPAFPWSGTRDFHVTDAVNVTTQLRSGAEVSGRVSVARRDASMSHQLAAVATIGLGIIPIPGGALPSLIVGSLAAGVHAVRSALRGDHASARTSGQAIKRNLLLAPIDLVPGLSGACLALAGGQALTAFHATLQGEDLADVAPLVEQIRETIANQPAAPTETQAA